MVPVKLSMCAALAVKADRKTVKQVKAHRDGDFLCAFCGKAKVEPKAGALCEVCGAWVASVDWRPAEAA